MSEKLYDYVKNVKWEDNEFSIEKAYIFSRISKLIYQYKRKSPKDRVNFYDLTQTTTEKDGDLKEFLSLLEQNEIQLLFVLETPYGVTIGISFNNVIIVASRGTKYWKDWGINLNVLKAKTVFDKVKFHKGFNNIADISIFKVWHRLAKRKEPIYFTGHSLGAAVSAILFLKFKYSYRRFISNHKIISAYTFGMPRFFNHSLFPIEDIHHFYNDLDIVPKIPFKIAGFKNLPCEYTFDDEKLILTVKRKRFQLFKSMKLFFTKKLIAEHDIDLYSKLIKKNIK
jgi:hypothetical protein